MQNETRLDSAVRRGFARLLKADGRQATYHTQTASVTLNVLVDEVSPEMKEYLKVSTERDVFQVTVLRSALESDGSLIFPQRGHYLECSDRLEIIPGGNRRFWDYEESGRVLMTFYAQKVNQNE